MGKVLRVLEEVLDDMILQAKIEKENRERFKNVDRKYKREATAIIEESAKEAYLVSQSNHGGGSPFPFRYF